MIELTRSNDPVFLSFLMARLSDEGIEAVLLDAHTSAMEGSISAIQRRIMVFDEDLKDAKAILAEAQGLADGTSLQNATT